MDELLIPLSISFLLIGVGLGAAFVWLSMRKSAETAVRQARSETLPEIARLNEKLASGTGEKDELRRSLEATAAKHAQLHEQLQRLLDERARLEERANRVPELESRAAEYSAELTARQAEFARLSMQIKERTRECELLQEHLNKMQDDHKALLAKLDSLQSDLEKEKNRAAGLGQQALSLPEVNDKLRLATDDNEQLKAQLADLQQKLSGTESTVAAQLSRIRGLEAGLALLTANRDQLLADQERLKTHIAELTISIESGRQQGAEKAALLSEVKEQLSTSFRSLAAEIFEDKSQRFTDLNKANIGQILEPLKTTIQEFQGQVEQVYVQEGKDRSALAEQVRQLVALNQQLSQETNNLTLVLKGSSKTQGNWGEVVLERVLEDSGLRKDRDYLIRPTYAREDGTLAEPDAVVLLPESRNLIVDAKVSLVAYEEYAVAENETARASAVQRHIASIRGHISGLSGTNYQALGAVKSIDFVVMFVPIEPAFIVAVANDPNLWQDAWQKNVLLVSPSTFLFVVRTVANLWRQELQKRSIQEIVRRSAELYDKLVGFVDDLRTVGDCLVQAKDNYDNAYAKLHTGKGSAIHQADELLKELGVKPTKSLPSELVETAIDPRILSLASENGGGIENLSENSVTVEKVRGHASGR
jgi:DNA recombination protein RmuC